MKNGCEQGCQEHKINDAFVDGQHETPEVVDPWEECGCILWDLAVNKSHAEFMVHYFFQNSLIIL